MRSMPRSRPTRRSRWSRPTAAASAATRSGWSGRAAGAQSGLNGHRPRTVAGAAPGGACCGPRRVCRSAVRWECRCRGPSARGATPIAGGVACHSAACSRRRSSWRRTASRPGMRFGARWRSPPPASATNRGPPASTRSGARTVDRGRRARSSGCRHWRGRSNASPRGTRTPSTTAISARAGGIPRRFGCAVHARLLHRPSLRLDDPDRDHVSRDPRDHAPAEQLRCRRPGAAEPARDLRAAGARRLGCQRLGRPAVDPPGHRGDQARPGRPGCPCHRRRRARCSHRSAPRQGLRTLAREPDPPGPADRPGPVRTLVGGTIYLATVDADGNAVSLIQSNAAGFGSGVVDPDTGIHYQNRGSSFSLDEGHPNELAPGKRTTHSLLPGMLFRDGERSPWIVVGSIGGDIQPPDPRAVRVRGGRRRRRRRERRRRPTLARRARGHLAPPTFVAVESRIAPVVIDALRRPWPRCPRDGCLRRRLRPRARDRARPRRPRASRGRPRSRHGPQERGLPAVR